MTIGSIATVARLELAPPVSSSASAVGRGHCIPSYFHLRAAREFRIVVLLRIELSIDQHRSPGAGGDGRDGGVFARRDRSVGRCHAFTRQRHARQPERRFLFIADHDGAHGARDRRFGRCVQWFFCCLHASPGGGRDTGQHVHHPQSQSLDHAQSRRPCARGPVQILHG